MNSFRVTDKWRTNPLSEKPGGSVLLVEENGKGKIYDKVKYVWAYIKQLKKNKNITKVWLQNEDGKPAKLLWQLNLK